MNLNRIKINNLEEIFMKFNGSWIFTGISVIITPELQLFLPVISQIILLVVGQMFMFFIDFMRLKYLNEKRKSKLIQDEQKISVESETDDGKS